MRALALILSLSLSLQGCVTAYRGPTPDLTLTGAVAQAEGEKFHMNDGFWTQGNFVTMGPEKTPYYVSSALPVIEKVSPNAGQKMARAENLWNYQVAFVGVALAGLIVALASPEGTTRDAWLIASLGADAASISIFFVRMGMQTSALHEYNRELKQKLNPTVGLNWTY